MNRGQCNLFNQSHILLFPTVKECRKAGKLVICDYYLYTENITLRKHDFYALYFQDHKLNNA